MEPRRALLSVSDKTGLVAFAGGLVDLGYELLSTGGTARALEAAGLPVTPVAEVTGVPEMLGGRVKTLHPAIFGGILARRDRLADQRDLAVHKIRPIDLVAVNLYPFQEAAGRPGAALEDVIEEIDIGGPSLIRAAAKNHVHVVVVTDPAQYGEVLEALRREGMVDRGLRYRLAVAAFRHTAQYDAAIAEDLARRIGGGPADFPDRLALGFVKLGSLRYGENAHQQAAFYRELFPAGPSVATARQLHGKPLSYNNVQDADAALGLVREFHEPAAVAVKHTNPCGVACGRTAAEAYRRARDADPVSIFGGIVALNRTLDVAAAEALVETFLEVVLAPDVTGGALSVLRQKRDLRVLAFGPLEDHPGGGATEDDRRARRAAVDRQRLEGYDLKKVAGGLLVQELDAIPEDPREWKRVAGPEVPAEAMRDLWFAWRVVKHAKSNAIVVARDLATLGVGAGQTNRIDAARFALERAGAAAAGAVLASDAFFPFPDVVEAAAGAGIRAIVQPGGSIRDKESIAAAETAGIAMFFTGIRHFRH